MTIRQLLDYVVDNNIPADTIIAFIIGGQWPEKVGIGSTVGLEYYPEDEVRRLLVNMSGSDAYVYEDTLRISAS